MQTTLNELTIKQQAYLATTILDNPYIPHEPLFEQAHFLANKEEEILFGGAAGGGKSDALLMAALQYVTEPDYSALLLRRTYQDLSQPNAIMDRAKKWLDPFTKNGEVHWNNQIKTFTFQSMSMVPLDLYTATLNSSDVSYSK